MPNEQIKERIMPHLTHEVDGLIVCAKLYHEAGRRHDEKGTMIYYECFLLHARNLIEFFLNKNTGDTVHVKDFILVEEKYNSLEIGNKYYARICKQLNHISYSRINENIEFPVHEILKAIVTDVDTYNAVVGAKLKIVYQN